MTGCVGPGTVSMIRPLPAAISRTPSALISPTVTPPMAVSLIVTTRIAGVSMESTVRWVIWMVGAMLIALALIAVFPQLALWLPRTLGY